MKRQPPDFFSSLDSFDLQSFLDDKKNAIDAALIQALDHFRNHINPTTLVDAMQYSVEAGGKRLRPILCLAACEMVGGTDSNAMHAACALEFIHTYSLIHDDLPAMDNDDLRRGKPTCHKVFGEAVAILAGDGLLTAAFELLAAEMPNKKDVEKNLNVIRIIAKAAGATGMVQGQTLDLLLEGKDVTWKEARHMHRLKTGTLIQASLDAGAVLGEGNLAQVTAIRSYGLHIGLAFQLVDDILNVEGDASVLGKPVGSDQALKKATAPAILGLEQTKVYARQLLDAALDDLNSFGSKGEPLAALAYYVIDRDK